MHKEENRDPYALSQAKTKVHNFKMFLSTYD